MTFSESDLSVERRHTAHRLVCLEGSLHVTTEERHSCGHDCRSTRNSPRKLTCHRMRACRVFAEALFITAKKWRKRNQCVNTCKPKEHWLDVSDSPFTGDYRAGLEVQCPGSVRCPGDGGAAAKPDHEFDPQGPRVEAKNLLPQTALSYVL